MEKHDFNVETLLTLKQLKLLNNLYIYEHFKKAAGFSSKILPIDFIHSIIGNELNIPLHKIQEANIKAKLIRSRCKELNIDIIEFNDISYPVELINLLERRIDVPPLLFYKGHINRLNNSKKIAIVGTRNPTHESLNYAFKLAEGLSSHNYSVISGLAIGCDTQAHLGGLSGKIKHTVAILAGGLDLIYPAENQKLANEIVLQGGALLTEVAPEEIIYKWSFTERNRIQSALSEAVVIIETQLKGGTMATANYAFKQKKPIFVLGGKGRIDNIRFSGNTKLISKGAIELSGVVEKDIDSIIKNINLFNLSIKTNSFSFDESTYQSLSIKEIKQICNERGIDYNKSISKIELIAKIRSHLQKVDIFSE
jgi:DNA processing protein